MPVVSFTLNGKPARVDVDPDRALLWVLRDDLGLTGTKYGCGQAVCGSCTVLVDAEPVRSCTTRVGEVAGRRVLTIEGLADGDRLNAVQQAFVDHHAFQCGYCTPGQVMAVEGLLRANPEPTLEQIREGVSGNLCRCGAYPHIFNAARKASELRKERS